MPDLENNTGVFDYEPEYFTSKQKPGEEYPRWKGECLVEGIFKEMVMETRGKGEDKVLIVWFNKLKEADNPFDV